MGSLNGGQGEGYSECRRLHLNLVHKEGNAKRQHGEEGSKGFSVDVRYGQPL